MGLYEPDKTKMSLPRHGFRVDADNLAFLVDDVQTGRIVHLPPSLVGEIASGLSTNPDAMYFASSGVPISHDYDGAFQYDQTLLAIEMVRYEPNPKLAKSEPHFNLNRYVFGISTADDKAYGIDVTTWKSNPITAQVGNHWDEIDAYIDAHFPKQKDGGGA